MLDKIAQMDVFLVRSAKNSSDLRIKAARVVFSLAEALLLIERSKKNAALAAFNSNGGRGGT